MRLRRAVLQAPAESSVPPRLPLYKGYPPLTLLESTLLQVLIPLHFISFRINTYTKPGGGCPSQDAKVSQPVTPPTWPHHAHGCARRVHPGPAAIPVFPYSFLPNWEPSTLSLISEHCLATPILLLSTGCQLSAVSSPASPFPVHPELRRATLLPRVQARGASLPQIAENRASLSPAAATLTDSVMHKSFVCHSYKKHRGGGRAWWDSQSRLSLPPFPRATDHGSRITDHGSPATPPLVPKYRCAATRKVPESHLLSLGGTSGNISAPPGV